MDDILKLTATGISKAVAGGEISAQKVTQAYLSAIARHDAAIGAYRQVNADAALAQASSVDAKRSAGQKLGPLAGVPVAIKDNICAEGFRTTCASKILGQFAPPYSATVVRKMLAADAVIVGTVNMDEFAMGSSTENSAFGPTRNPWDVSRVPGGSSGGSAAAVAARLAAAALGSDTGGSIRQPAAFCGTVGMKPTYGRVSRYGLVAFGSSLDQIGPLTRDVADCALMTSVISGHDPMDSTSLPGDAGDLISQLDVPIEKLRIGMPKEFFSKALDSEIHSAIDAAAKKFQSLGATLVEVSLPNSRIDQAADGSLSSFAVACYYIVATAEASSNLARFDGIRYGHRTSASPDDIVDLYCKSRSEGFGDEVKRRIMLGSYTLSSGYYDAYYLKALKVRRLIKDDFDRAFQACDVLLCPTTPTTAFKIGEKSADPLQMYLADIYTISLNLAGLPGLSMPVGLSSSGLPMGMQLIGPALGEQATLRAARMYEKSAGGELIAPMVK